jgi:hypothetical protein
LAIIQSYFALPTQAHPIPIPAPFRHP